MLSTAEDKSNVDTQIPVIYIYLQDKIGYSSSLAYARVNQDVFEYHIFGHSI